MHSRTILLLCGLLAGYAVVSRGQGASSLAGYVTRSVSGSDFDVNGYHILCNKKTRNAFESVNGTKVSGVGCPSAPPFIGEALIVYGPLNVGSSYFKASRIQSLRSGHHEIAGSAVIDATPAQDATDSSSLIVRADGYRININGNTKTEWNPPLQSLADVKAGNWIRYKGKIDATGVLVAASVEIGANVIDSREEKLRAGKEYDPSAVPADARQNYLKAVLSGGYDPKKFPPFTDAEMQARVETIGSNLVPAYQRALPDSDPTKIHFRFQVIDNNHFCGLMQCDTLTLPNGIILVPHQVVERMQNDSQLATVLADSIARALEKQQYRTEGKTKAAYASMLAAPFVPYVALGMSVGGGVITSIERKAMEQSGRVSLALLRDAGYDINQAPMAWWLLATEKPKPLSEIEMPDRAGYLYRMLGEIWNNPAASAAKVP